MNESRPVRVVNIRDPGHTLRFPSRDSAERWISYRTPELWRIEPTGEVHDGGNERHE